MASTNIWIDQLREAGESPDAVSKLVKALEAQGLDVKVCYKKTESVKWLSQARAVQQSHWQTPVVVLAGLVCSLGVIVCSIWSILV